MFEYRNWRTHGVRHLGYMNVIANKVCDKGVGFQRERLEEYLVEWTTENEVRIPNIHGKPPRIPGLIYSQNTASNYINLAHQFQILTPSEEHVYPGPKCRLYQYIGKKRHNNPLYLNDLERLCFLYELLSHDADVILQILGHFIDNKNCDWFPRTLGAWLPQEIKKRLREKPELRMSGLNKLRKQQHAYRFRAHKFNVPIEITPRLEWLDDCGVLWKPQWNLYSLADPGISFTEEIPYYENEENSVGFYDINTKWLQSEVFNSMQTIVDDSIYSKVSEPLYWENFSDEKQIEIGSKIWSEVYEGLVYERSLLPNKVRLDIASILFCILAMVKRGTIVELKQLWTWLKTEPTIGKYTYYMRTSGRPNEAYLLRVPATG